MKHSMMNQEEDKNASALPTETMPMYEYKDKVCVINKLIDTNNIFLQINSTIIK